MKYEEDLARFKSLTFDDYKLLSKDDTLSKYQKIGFPDSYRKGKEKYVFRDIIKKLDLDNKREGLTLLDIGPGCSDLPIMILDFCKKNQYHVLLADSQEMLENLPDDTNVSKYPGYFPDDSPILVNQYQNKVDYIVCYSVLQVVFYQTCVFKFIDAALSLLRSGGKFLIGDIPNITKRKRFFSTQHGIEFHQNFTRSDSLPDVSYFTLEPAQIDDGVILGILQRYRGFGFETYLLPQSNSLPMGNRREDILICKI